MPADSAAAAAGDRQSLLEGFKRTLVVQLGSLGPGHKETAVTIFKVGELQFEMGALQDAEDSLKNCLKIQRRVVGDDSVETFKTLSLLGQVHRSAGKLADAAGDAFGRRFQSAIKCYQKSLVVAEHLHGPMSVECLASLQQLASLYEHVGNYDQALLCRQRCSQMLDGVQTMHADTGAKPDVDDLAQKSGGDAVACQRSFLSSDDEELSDRQLPVRRERVPSLQLPSNRSVTFSPKAAELVDAEVPVTFASDVSTATPSPPMVSEPSPINSPVLSTAAPSPPASESSPVASPLLREAATPTPKAMSRHPKDSPPHFGRHPTGGVHAAQYPDRADISSQTGSERDLFHSDSPHKSPTGSPHARPAELEDSSAESVAASPDSTDENMLHDPFLTRKEMLTRSLKINAVSKAPNWHVQLDRSTGSDIGIAMNASGVIRILKPGGLLWAWNRINPARAVLEGDTIIEVNARRGVPAVVEEMREHGVMNIVVCRGDGAESCTGDKTERRCSDASASECAIS